MKVDNHISIYNNYFVVGFLCVLAFVVTVRTFLGHCS